MQSPAQEERRTADPDSAEDLDHPPLSVQVTELCVEPVVAVSAHEAVPAELRRDVSLDRGELAYPGDETNVVSAGAPFAQSAVR